MTTFSYFESPEFLIYSSHALVAIEIPIHLFGAYCILTKTPNKMKPVKMCISTLFFFGAFLDFTLTCLLIPYLTVPALGGIAFGLLQYFGVSNPIQTWFGVTNFGVTACSILLCFENRYDSLIVKNHLKTRSYCIKRYIYLSLNFLIALLFFIPAVYNTPDQVLAKEYVRKIVPNIPSYIIDDPEFYVIGPDTQTTVICVAAMIIFQFFQDLFFVVKLFHYFLTQNGMSKQTKQLQKMFFLSMELQIFIPVGILLIPAFYVVYSIANNYHNQALNNIITLIIAIHGVISTIVMIAIHKSYRMVLLKFISPKTFNRVELPKLKTVLGTF
ncbi:unnamed protein product [Caenorhabditis angaria]|uniref:Serpentine Receptor, class H n=1 Tax=Caenorhabditis angaria TaxID=860376 RepID=A0A9P1IVK1_9PELO|nr:unnamed protein product [Caenorhabditis angaria]